jgi:hypothetical protein
VLAAIEGTNLSAVGKNAHFHTLLIEVNNNQWFSQYKINLAFEICIRLEHPEESELKNFSKANLEEILLRLDAKGIFHNISYGIKSDDDYENTLNYCLKYNNNLDKTQLLVSLSVLSAFKVFEPLFSFPTNVFKPTTEEIDTQIQIFLKLQAKFLDILINPIFKTLF